MPLYFNTANIETVAPVIDTNTAAQAITADTGPESACFPGHKI